MTNEKPDLVEEASLESFPASDPPAWTLDGPALAPAETAHQRKTEQLRERLPLWLVVVGTAVVTGVFAAYLLDRQSRHPRGNARAGPSTLR